MTLVLSLCMYEFGTDKYVEICFVIYIKPYLAGLQKLFVMAQAATATAPGALHAFSSSTAGNASFKASSVNVASWKSQPKRSLAVRASGESENANVGFANRSETGIVFEPFAEVQSQLVQVPSAYSESLARHRYSPSCEAAINDQIKYETSKRLSPFCAWSF